MGRAMTEPPLIMAQETQLVYSCLRPQVMTKARSFVTWVLEGGRGRLCPIIPHGAQHFVEMFALPV